MLTSTGHRELLLDGRDLALDLGQLLLEGLLGLSSAYNDSRSEHQGQDVTKAHRVNPGQRQGLTFHHDLKVGSYVLGLLLGVL
jgi:hypothetical protein